MENFFQNLITKVKETLSPIGGVSPEGGVSEEKGTLSPEGGVSEVKGSPIIANNDMQTRIELKKMEEKLKLEDDYRCGGITELKGIEDCPIVNYLALFAVDQQNNKKNAILEFMKILPQKKEFVKVVSAKEKAVSGTKEIVPKTWYYITLEAKVGEKVNVYEAKIWDQPLLDLKQLTEFKRLGDDPSVDSANGNYQICDQFV